MGKVIAAVLILCGLAFPADQVIAKAHKTTHHLVMKEAVGEGIGECSGTAIAPHALLTAAHCVGIMRTLIVDGKSTRIVETMLDPYDHAIFLLDGVEFSDYAELSKDQVSPGDSVFIFGNPGEFKDLFRRGYVSGIAKDSSEDIGDDGDDDKDKPDVDADSPDMTMYDLNGFFGDSGSALFDDKGKIVGVISMVVPQGHAGVANKYMSSLPFAFTDFQMKRAKDYRPADTGKGKAKKDDDSLSDARSFLNHVR